MTIKVRTIRPGRMVNLKTKIEGNISHTTRVIEEQHTTSEGALKETKEVETTIADAADYEAAKKVRGLCRTAVTRCCASSEFGLLCPDLNIERLENGIREGERLAAEHNATSKFSYISFNVMCGDILHDDTRALKAINTELAGLLKAMEQGVEKLDAEMIREAANKAKSVSTMLEKDGSERIKTAISIARNAANTIVKAGTSAAQKVDEEAIRKIAAMRTSFLDIGNDAEIGEVVIQGRAVAFEPTDFDVKVSDDEMTPAEQAWVTRRRNAEAASLAMAVLQADTEAGPVGQEQEADAAEMNDAVNEQINQALDNVA